MPYANVTYHLLLPTACKITLMHFKGEGKEMGRGWSRSPSFYLILPPLYSRSAHILKCICQRAASNNEHSQGPEEIGKRGRVRDGAKGEKKRQSLAREESYLS